MRSLALFSWALVAVAAPSPFLEARAQEPAATPPAEGVTVDEIRVEGTRRSEPEAVRSVIATREGQKLDRDRLRADIRAIFQLGFYTDVKADLTQVNAKNVLTFIVEEKPSIHRIIYEGNDEISDDDIAAVVDLKPEGILDRAKVQQNAEKIRDLYLEKGYFLAEVDWDVVNVPDNEVDVVFRISEKQEVKVAKVTIIGNQALTDPEIKEILETREDSFLSFLTGAGTFKSEALDRDQQRVHLLYLDHGYINVRVGQPSIQLSPDKTRLFVGIPVEEGERYHTGSLDVSGDMLVPKEQLMGMIKLRTGEWFSHAEMRQTLEDIGKLYKDEGYAYVNVVPNTNVDPDKRIVHLTFEIEKGPKVRFGRILVIGNTRTRDKVIRRELRIYEGEYYSETGIERSKQLVTRLGYFETVDITTRRGSAEDTMDVVIEVKEKPTGTFQVGAGFSSIESFIAQAQIAQNNLFGRGQSLSLQAQISKIRTIADVRFADDYFLDTLFRFAIDVFRFDTTFEDFTRQSYGGDVTLGYPITDDWSVATTYTLEQVNVKSGGFATSSAPSIANLFNDGLTSSVQLALYYDTRDNRLFPSSGWFISGSVEEASEYLGSDNQFTRYDARARYYYPVGWDIVLKMNAEWGLITSPERTGVPIFERFFVGGPLSVRGFRRNTLGPEIQVPSSQRPDSSTLGQNIGGTEELLLNAELEFPIFQKVGIRGVFFTDAGNAFDRRDPIGTKIDQLRYSWGFGIRWISPIGPLRFEWGFPFSPQAGEESSVFDFSIGNFF
jgi:outer membrane protein insertion porin family